MKRKTALSVGLLGMAWLAQGAAPEPQASTREVMLALTIPASDAVFGVGSKEPTSAAEWERVAANAMLLAESGRLLRTGGRDPGKPEWGQFANELTRAALQAAAAARQQDIDATLEAGNAAYETCEGCHAKFMAVRAPAASN
jgi:hypothetical protein